MASYNVKIEKRPKNWVDDIDPRQYWWGVSVETDKYYHYRSRTEKTGWAFTLKSAKKKAIKQIMKAESIIGDGSSFGVVVNTSGNAEEIIKALS